jgi:hypothetical protein
VAGNFAEFASGPLPDRGGERQRGVGGRFHRHAPAAPRRGIHRDERHRFGANPGPLLAEKRRGRGTAPGVADSFTGTPTEIRDELLLAGAGIDECCAGAYRTLPGQAGDRHEPALGGGGGCGVGHGEGPFSDR